MEDNPCPDARSRSGLRSWVRSSGAHRVDIPKIAPLFMDIVVLAVRGVVECPASIQTRLHLWSNPPGINFGLGSIRE
ncbi:hypothetical protein M0802_012558 [Mischocyttarus mexicanus]|nr:hypothetical protein M0802_012558 [Mischocyttarus mexicanus]